MPVHLIGDGSGSAAPFSRTFFNVTLGDLLKKAGGTDESLRFTLYLTDGMKLAVCKIEQLAEAYMVVRGYREEDSSCDLTVHVIPYGLIYRMEIEPEGTKEESRLGFNWSPDEVEAG